MRFKLRSTVLLRSVAEQRSTRLGFQEFGDSQQQPRARNSSREQGTTSDSSQRQRSSFTRDCTVRRVGRGPGVGRLRR